MNSLTNQDRDRFAAYLESCARDDDAMAVQCEAIGEKTISKKLRTEAMAAKIIAAKLMATEFQTITIGDTTELPSKDGGRDA